MATRRESPRPTKTKDRRWLIHPNFMTEDDLEATDGKWLVYRYFSELDSLWNKLKGAFNAGRLNAVAIKSSALYYNPSDTGPGPCIDGAIRVYTNFADVDRVGKQLIEIVQHDIKYKTNEATRAGHYYHKDKARVSALTLFWNHGKPTKKYRRGIKQIYSCPSDQDLWELNIAKAPKPLCFQPSYGKWVIISNKAITKHWHLLKKEVESGTLGAIKMICPANPGTQGNPIIEVYTTRDAKDSVQERIRNILGESLNYEWIQNDKPTRPSHVQQMLEEEVHHLAISDRVMREKGKLAISVLQCMLSGLPRVGKSTLLSRLVPRPKASQTPTALVAPDMPDTDTTPFHPTVSTGVAEGILQVCIKNATQLTAIASTDQLEKIWQLLDLDTEAIMFLKTIISSHDRQLAAATPTSSQEVASLRSKNAVAGTLATNPQEVSSGPKILAATPKGERNQEKMTHASIPGSESADDISKKGEAPVTTALPGYKSINNIFKEARMNEKWSNARAFLEGSCTLYFTDTGGQPECQEVLPSLIAGPSVFFLVFNLMHSLDERYKIQFVRSPSEKTVEYTSSFTVKEVLLRSLASIAATCTYSTQQSKDPIPIEPRVMIIGTHKDKVSTEHIKHTQKELKDTLKEMGFYKLLVFASEDEPVIAINNLATDEREFRKVRQLVERIANQPAFRIPIPAPWLAFSFCLRLLDDSVPVISYEQCCAIAEECGIDTEEEVKEALWHLHTKMGVLRYFHSIPELQDIVIRMPQLIFSKVTELIASTFTFQNPSVLDPYTVERFQQQGLFSVDVIAKLTATCSDLLTSDKLLKLLETLHIIAPIRDETGKVIQYFIPCVLTHAPEYKAENKSDALVPALLVTFKCGYCPKGLFCALVAYLLTEKVCCGLEWRLDTTNVYRNRVSFKVGKEHSIVSITAHLTHLEVLLDVQTNASRSLLTKQPHDICNTIRQAVKESTSAVSLTLHYGSDTAIAFGFYSPSCPLKPAICLEEEEPKVKECVSCKVSTDLTPHQLAWFGVPLQTEVEATAPKTTSEQNLELTIKNALSTVNRWFELGEQLGLPYHVLEEIEIDHVAHGTTRQRSKMIHTWLEKNPAAPWSELCEALERMGKCTLAQTIWTEHMGAAGFSS